MNEIMAFLAGLLALVPGLGAAPEPSWNGYVEADYVYVGAPSAGTIETVVAREGQAVKAGEVLFVPGAAGGIGSAAVELGKAMGAHVVVAASTNDKVQFALELGADNGLIYPAGQMDQAAQKELSGEIKLACGRDGADVVLDGVGGDYAEPALRAMDWNGRYLVVGFPAGIPAFPLNLTLLKSVSVIGVFWGAHAEREPDLHRANMADLLRLYSEGRIKPRISKRFRFEDAGDAIKALGDRTALGKIVVEIE